MNGRASIVMAVALVVSTGLGAARAAPPKRTEVPPPEVVPPALLAPLELPTALPARRDRAVTLQMVVTVGVDGVPTEVVAAPSDTASEALRQVVIAALKKARFRPATRGGEPLAVKVSVPVTVDAGASSVWRLERREGEPVPTVERGIEGRVVERGTRRPVAGVAVKLGDREVLSDEDGRFAFRDVPRGRYVVEVPFFADAKGTVQVPGTITLRVTPDALREYRTRITGGTTSTSDAVRIRVPVERAREIAGSSGDPLKVLESLPGLARPAAAGPGAGEIAVRGSAPEDTKTYVEGMPLLQLYHFGNVYSVLQDEWIGEIDFRAGGFSTEYGDALGGMVDVTLADLKRDGVHGHGDVNVYHVAGLVTAPVSEDWTIGAAVRRSWVDAILGGILGDDSGFRFSTAPRYYDYQVRADYHPGGTTRLKLLAFGSDDEIVVLGERPDASDPNGSGFAFGRFFHQVQATSTLDLNPELQLALGLATSYQQITVTPGTSRLQITFDPVTLRADLDYRGVPKLRVRGGLWAEATRFRVELNVPRPTKEGQVQLPSEVLERFEVAEEGLAGRLDAWGEATWDVSDAVSLSGGLRVASWYGNFQAVAPDLRVALGWKASDATRLTLTTGLNHQAPSPDESAESIGNTELSPERSFYVNVGASQRIGEWLGLELQGFWKSLDQLVVGTAYGDDLPYDNAGTGTIFGGEALLRLQHPVVDAWVAYTLSRSRRVDRPGEEERFFSFDQTHVLAVVAGVQLGAGWRFGARVRYATGNPFTPLEPAYFDAGSNVWVPRAAGAALSDRAPAFFQLDLRIDKTWLFDAWKLDVYFELSNATNRGNVESVQYAPDYRSRDDITSLPLVPSLGVRGSF